MNFSLYTEYISKCIKELNKLNKITRGGVFLTYFDFLGAAIKHGCLINQYVHGNFYELSDYSRKQSMTYRRIVNTIRCCNRQEYIHILENKNEFNAYFNKYVSRSWIYAKDMQFTAFQKLCHSVDYIIIKPLDLCEGQGVKKVISPKADNEVRDLFEEYSGQNFMIEECIKQHPNMSFGSKSVNTIRMHSILDKNGDVHLFKPVARVGTGDAIIDNYCGGGCAYEVDLESGVIISPSLSKDHGSCIIHPGTNIKMLGCQIPNWEKVISGVKDAAKSFPQCRFIGWDVAIIENGIELIEGNHNPDYELIEFVGTKGWYGKIKQFI